MFRNEGFIFYMECLFAYIYNMLCLLLPCEKNPLIISNGKKVNEHLKNAIFGHFSWFVDIGRNYYLGKLTPQYLGI